MNISDISILNIKKADYRYIVSGISKNKAKNLMQNADLTEKRGTYITIFLLVKKTINTLFCSQ